MRYYKIESDGSYVGKYEDIDTENYTGILDGVTVPPPSDGKKYYWYPSGWRAEEIMSNQIKVVPQVVYMRQARLALLEKGLLTQVQSVIDNLQEPLKSLAKIEWEYATEIRRDWPTLSQIVQHLSLTEEQIDDLFILAGTK